MRPTKTHNYPHANARLLVFIVAAFVLVGISAQASAGFNQLPEPPNCQYLNRATNQPASCDNSDPCDPASAAKGGSGECLEQPLVLPEVTSHNIIEPNWGK